MTPVDRCEPDPATPSHRRSLPPALAAVLAAVTTAALFAVLAAAALTPTSWLARFDARVATAAHGYTADRPDLGAALVTLAALTHPNTMRAVALLLVIALLARARHLLACWLALTMTIGGLLSPLLKELVGRPRPVFPDPVAVSGNDSFPSGHALNSLVLALCVLTVGRALGAGPRLRAGLAYAATGLVVVTAADRILLAVHYPSDVLAGWLVALGTVAVTTRFLGGDAEARARWRPRAP